MEQQIGPIFLTQPCFVPEGKDISLIDDFLAYCGISRFDRLIYLGVSDNHKAQLSIIEALTRKFQLDPALDLRKVAEKCPFNYTGADFYALCSDAMIKAMSRTARNVDASIGKPCLFIETIVRKNAELFPIL